MKSIHNILLIDDEKSNLDILVNIFETIPHHEYYDITACLSAKDGLELLQKRDFDLILLDVLMPQMDGFEMCKILKNDPKTVDIPVIFITASSDEESIEKGYEVGGVDYVLKPFLAKELISRVNTHLSLAFQKTKLLHIVEEQITQLREQDKVLQQQSQLAAMGEMIDAVAHQWKQPLSILNLLEYQIRSNLQNNKISKELLNNFLDQILQQTRHMSNTLDEFRSFFRTDKTIHSIRAIDLIKSVINLVTNDFRKYNIKLQYEVIDDIFIDCIDNEMKHVFLNIINNARDAMVENDIKNGSIHFKIEQIDDKKIITIADNAGGIPENIIEHIFKPNFTTKKDGKGTGVGLYMSKQIVEKIGASIDVTNSEDGATFQIIF